MGNLFVIKGMGRGFDGLVVEAEPSENNPGLRYVTRIINHNAIFGDRNVSFPVMAHALFLNDGFLEKFDGELREFDSKNPNGKFVCESRHRRHDLEVVVAEYERCLTVSVLEHMHEEGKYNDVRGRDTVHTRYTQSFKDRLDTVKTLIENEIRMGDLDDLIFHLRKLKEIEFTGIPGTEE
jgi:hypothetical protein